MRHSLRILIGVGSLALPACAGNIDTGPGRSQNSSGELPSTVNTTSGPMSTEGEYLPGVVHAELGWYTTNQEALKAQAVSARTYLAQYLNANGFGAQVPIGPVFMAWTNQFGSDDVAAVSATAGQTMHYAGQLIYSNFDSGADSLDGSCNPPSPSSFGYPYSTWGAMQSAFVAGTCVGCGDGTGSSYAWTQIFVTDNQGLTGGGVHPTVQASATSQNRGALGQYQDSCFADVGWSYTQILRYFYGADIEIDGVSTGGSRPQIASSPVGVNADGRIEAFVKGTGGDIQHVWQRAPNSGWSSFASFGGLMASNPAAALNSNGSLEWFVFGTDGSLWHQWETPSWSGWARLDQAVGGFTSDPAVGVNADGRLEVFAIRNDGTMWHIWQLRPHSSWSSWSSFGGGFTGNPAVMTNTNGTLEVFATGSDGNLWHRWQGAGWSGWSSLGGATVGGSPAVGINSDGRLEVVVRMVDDSVSHIWQLAPHSGWSAWSSFGGSVPGDAALATDRNGMLWVFDVGFDGNVWYQTETPTWSGWQGLGGGTLSANLAVQANADGRLEVFARSTDGTLHHAWQLPGGGWSTWASLGGSLASF